jgi:hypothetical protein
LMDENGAILTKESEFITNMGEKIVIDDEY